MDSTKAGVLADRLKAVADSNRLLILYELLEGSKSVTDLGRALGVHQTRVSRHLRLLRYRGLVSYFLRDGRHYYHLLRPGFVRAILQLLDLEYGSGGLPADDGCPADVARAGHRAGQRSGAHGRPVMRLQA